MFILKKYELYTTAGIFVTSFESTWQFRDSEQIFVHFAEHKRNFVIVHITHDVDEKYGHVARLYCQEKKVY